MQSMEEAEDMENLYKKDYTKEKSAEYFKFLCGEKKAYLKYKEQGFTRTGQKCS